MREGSSKPRFIVDAMLGNMISWLRILGYDTLYWEGDDKKLIEVAMKEDRIILTMDRDLALIAARNGLEAFLIPNNEASRILAELSKRYGISLEFDPYETRCPVCNHLLEMVNAESREEWICPSCGKKYWKGSHWRNIMKTIMDARRERARRRP